MILSLINKGFGTYEKGRRGFRGAGAPLERTLSGESDRKPGRAEGALLCGWFAAAGAHMNGGIIK